MKIPSDNNELEGHGDADDFTTLTPEDFSGLPPVTEDYYNDQNHRDSQQIMCWVIIAALLVALAIAIRKICG